MPARVIGVTSRTNGRTNAEVLIAFLAHVEPGTVVSYEALAAALADGSNREWDRQAVQSAVRAASRRILHALARTLVSVKGEGYRLTVGSDHHGLAIRRESRASTQLRRAVEVLRHAQYGEMSADERSVHDAHLVITGALFSQMQRVTRRQRQQDEAIQSLISRVDRLEQGDR